MKIDDEYERLLSLSCLEDLYECNHGYMDLEDCSWYHHNWMVLRYLGMVSNPFWHEQFYLSAINEYYSLEKGKALVMGSADFSMPYLCQMAGVKAITVSDLCKTPLNICDNVSSFNNFGWDTKQTNIFDGIDEYYDLIINDAFLTRFSYDKKRIVLERISDGLSPNGKYITTIRHGWNDYKPVIPDDEEQLEFITRTIVAAKKKSFNPIKAEYAAKQYIPRMVSYPIRDKEMLFRLVEGLFTIDKIDTATVSGECHISEYYRIVMTKRD